MPIQPHEKTVECPYNPHHRILEFRFARHLVNCRAQHTGPPLSICPLNSTHHVRPDKLDDHVKTCSSRKNIDDHIWSNKAHEQHLVHPPEVKEEVPNRKVCEGEGEWEEQNEFSYDPIEATKDRDIIRKPPSELTKAGRKAFRDQERKRRAQMEEDQKKQQEQLDLEEKKCYPEPLKSVYVPLRKPEGIKVSKNAALGFSEKLKSISSSVSTSSSSTDANMDLTGNVSLPSSVVAGRRPSNPPRSESSWTTVGVGRGRKPKGAPSVSSLGSGASAALTDDGKRLDRAMNSATSVGRGKKSMQPSKWILDAKRDAERTISKGIDKLRFDDA